MLLNKVLDMIHKPLTPVYESSVILKSLDRFVYFSILATFILATFLSSDVVGYLCFVTFLLTIVKVLTKPNENFKCEKFEIFLLIYFMLSIVSVAGSTLLHLSLKGFFKTFIYLSYYLSVVHHLKDNKKHILPILLCMAGCVTFESVIGLSQNFIQVGEISGWQDTSRLNPEEVMTRVYGTLQPLNPNLLGGYLVAGISSVFGLCAYYLHQHNYKRGLVFIILSVLASITLFLTGCRGAYIGLFLISSLIFIISLKYFWPTYKKIYFTVLSSVLSVCMLAIIGISSLRARVISIFAMRSDSSNSFRFNVYQSAIQMFKDNWAIGIVMGNQNFREIYGLYMKTGFDALSAYNIYLETAVESGIFTLLAFLCFLFSIVIDGAKYILKSKNTNSVIFASIGFLSICGVMIHGMVDTVFFRPQIQITFWTMVALLSSQIYSEN